MNDTRYGNVIDEERGTGKLIFNPYYSPWCLASDDLKEFEKQVELAKEHGFTHVNISTLTERTDYSGEDKDSPWCEWSVITPSIFKHVLPAGLEDAFPKDFVKRQFEVLKKRHDILGKYGLKCAYWGNEPHWLSNRIFEQHPEWRGPRVDNSLRSVGLFFAPCVDNPEVLELYRQAVKEMVTQCPLIDTFGLMTNDSGSGFCWSHQLYVNQNGNSDCRYRNMGDRVNGFYNAIKDGMRAAGVKEPDVRLTWVWFPLNEVHNIESKVEPGVQLTIKSLPGWGSAMHLLGFGSPINCISGILQAKKNKAADYYVAEADPRWLKAFSLSKNITSTGERAKAELLFALAKELYGEETVDEVVEAWNRINLVNKILHLSGLKLDWGVYCISTLRWLVRPLVAHPERLSPEEEDYWLPYLYQSEKAQPEFYKNYSAFTGAPMIKGWDHATIYSCAIDDAVDHLDSVISLFKQAQSKAANEQIKKDLLVQELLAKVERCIILSVRHTVQIAALIDERDKVLRTASVDLTENPANEEGSPGLYYMYRALRWELDNINNLIKILKEAPVPLIRTAADKKQESTFIYGQDLIQNLEKKVKIMLKYWRDAEDGYYRPTIGG